MTMKQLIMLGLALAGVLHASEHPNDAEMHDEGGEDNEPEEPEDDAPHEMLGEETVKALFLKIDKEGDGKITASELLAFAKHMRRKDFEEFHEQIWEESDTDKDGKLSLAELTTDGVVEESTRATFAAADTNGDGFLNKEESFGFFHMENVPAVEHAVAKFEMKINDKDGDDKLNMDEFEQMYIKADEDEEEEAVDATETKEVAKEMFIHLDTNKDGFIDAKEMQAYASGRHNEEQSLTKMAEHADGDGDGFITLQELWSSSQKEEAAEHMYHMESWAADLEL